MPNVTVHKAIKAVDLMAATDPGDVLIDALRVLGSQGAQAARDAGAAADAELRPSLQLHLTLYWD